MAEGGSGGILCRYFANGACREGNNCPFSHDRSSGRPDTICRYYLQGRCVFDSVCRYEHIHPTRFLFNQSQTTSGQTDRVLGQQPSCLSQGIKHNQLVTTASQSSNSDLSPSSESLLSRMTILKNQSQSADSGIGEEGSIVPVSSEWVNAPEFVPCSLIQSCVDKVKSNDGVHHSPTLPSNSYGLLCPYNLGYECSFGADCDYLHGDVCDICGRDILHPQDEKQRNQHRDECLKELERDMEISFAIQRSVGKCCGICMETVLDKQPPKERRFGILEKCNHVFCLSCIRKWRSTKQFSSKIIRACPECRVPSDFVTPSQYWVEEKEEKKKIIENYKEALSTKPCKYFKQGQGVCPFAGACFYLHAYPDGRKAELPPPRPRRRRNHGELETFDRIFLWDFFDIHDDQILFHLDIEDMFDLFTDTDEESEYSDLDL
ncbi:probable E3 ubiquitin-protein ligase makorin-1 [Limulus polyphemus]|uniref:RING-type E3 ubiquitin transferase n=1 Tax=Limulus polyphemus TaxID=6850 RepID=A0ABM1BQF3_LIMPO|nr:probable E3 ubiquitin-protein ligase makorin-1 [Limulus polyphemus]